MISKWKVVLCFCCLHAQAWSIAIPLTQQLKEVHSSENLSKSPHSPHNTAQQVDKAPDARLTQAESLFSAPDQTSIRKPPDDASILNQLATGSTDDALLKVAESPRCPPGLTKKLCLTLSSSSSMENTSRIDQMPYIDSISSVTELSGNETSGVAENSSNYEVESTANVRTSPIPASTTLSSLFSENLIPPLPPSWTDSDNDDWKTSNEANSSDPKTPDQRGLSRTLSTEDTIKEPKIPKPTEQVTTPSNSYSTVKFVGKAYMEERKSSGSKEKVSFITMPPGRHWYLWGDFAGRRKVDPFFDFPENMTGDITQVYTTYWGGGLPDQANKGIWIMKAGAGVSILILVVTITAQTAKFCHPQQSQKAMLTTNLATSFAAAHIVFIFGIQATKGAWACGVVALLLHFLHLLCCNWILALSVRLLRSLLRKSVFPTIAYCLPVWITSVAIVVGSYLFNPNGYEIRRYCWLSIEKGMLVSFIGPVCSLLLVNAGVCIASQKFLLEESGYSEEVERFDLKAGVVLLPLEGISWFLTVVALEDQYSIALDLAAAVATVAVSFFTLHLHVPGWRGVYSSLQCRPVASFADSDPVPLRSNSDPTMSSSSLVDPLACKAEVATLEDYPAEPLFPQNERGDVY